MGRDACSTLLMYMHILYTYTTTRQIGCQEAVGNIVVVMVVRADGFDSCRLPRAVRSMRIRDSEELAWSWPRGDSQYPRSSRAKGDNRISPDNSRSG